uniref:DNA2/NAM7 helicase-like C-terminal domain-containing protein n=1 Tax=Romanomermis culicivorax TaxID=13658 RepID=A0A915IRH7_ROMCU
MISGFWIAWVKVTGQESLEDNSCSIQNVQEARAIVNFMATLTSTQKFKNEDIIIITSYSTQVKLLGDTVLEACKAIKAGTYLQNRYLSSTEMENKLKKVQIGTVDKSQKCFLDTNVATRGESCKIKKLSIFQDKLWLPHFMDNLHYHHPEYAEKFGLKVHSRHRVLIHLHICQDVFRLLVGPLSRPPDSLYSHYCKNNIAFISEDVKRAQMFEFMCGYITTTHKYNPRYNWSLENAYGYLLPALHHFLTKGASWKKNKDARKEADRI